MQKLRRNVIVSGNRGALPFAFNDPKRVIPAVTIGSGVAHGLILTWGVTVPVLHGGIFSVPLASNPLLWIAAWSIGAGYSGNCFCNKPKCVQLKQYMKMKN